MFLDNGISDVVCIMKLVYSALNYRFIAQKPLNKITNEEAKANS